MTTAEAKEILKEIRPYKPQKTEGRRRQAAIDVAIATIDAYEWMTSQDQKRYAIKKLH